MCDSNIKIKMTFILLFFSSVAVAEMYKWVDEDGNTHYSQAPPVSDVKVETIAPPRAVDTESAQRELQRRMEKIDAITDKRMLAKEEKEKEEIEAEQTKEKCQQLNKRLKSLLLRPRANKKDEEGNLVRMGEEERQKEISDTTQQIKEKCS